MGIMHEATAHIRALFSDTPLGCDHWRSSLAPVDGKRTLTATSVCLPWPAVSSKRFLRPQVIYRYHLSIPVAEKRMSPTSTARAGQNVVARAQPVLSPANSLRLSLPLSPGRGLPVALSPDWMRARRTRHRYRCHSVPSWLLSASSSVRSLEIGGDRYTVMLIRRCSLWLKAKNLD